MDNKTVQMARIALPDLGEMTPDQQAVFDAVVSGPRGTIIGPLRAALLNPTLADRWQKLGETLRFKTSLPKNISELAIITTARRWASDLEWIIHQAAALDAGLSPDMTEAIKQAVRPEFSDPDEENVYLFTRQLLQTGKVDDAVYESVRLRWTDVGVMELTAVIGYYSMVAMTLNAHKIPLPNGAAALFHQASDEALTELG
ncbi:carboxymuconolactone decarboxylase family protein [Sulfitobacter sp. F26204]|uniref:carboxymuconolactone decarboxylase family protein n=1 Tax=Sulfitobacter sp. F26204 TaxID=2996014 RepID=UPI00225E1195|nr:carboxymuconolactone decarboxylase family protein [Sulfitobacter sp. F26204]MCX7561354.1 carboxymuconolactone decarboxylase family protein [Sulfitobacter sp. F26204]